MPFSLFSAYLHFKSCLSSKGQFKSTSPEAFWPAARHAELTGFVWVSTTLCFYSTYLILLSIIIGCLLSPLQLSSYLHSGYESLYDMDLLTLLHLIPLSPLPIPVAPMCPRNALYTGQIHSHGGGGMLFPKLSAWLAFFCILKESFLGWPPNVKQSTDNSPVHKPIVFL